MPDATLHGGTAQVNLSGGYALRTPGLKGRAIVHGPRTAGMRGPEMVTDAFDRAFTECGTNETATIELEVSSAPFPPAASPMRGPEGADAFELHVPDLGPDFGQVVLSIDEVGAMHWHFPLSEDLSVQPSTVRGGAGKKTFRIPREIASTSPEMKGDDRGLINVVRRKMLKVLVYPVVDRVLGALIEFAVGKWEAHKHPPKLRRYLPDDGAMLTPNDWKQLATGPALLFVHGTFSSADAAFGSLSPATLKELAARYGNRVFAFDHPTMSVDPVANVKWFLEQLPPGISIDVDVVSHSRGGLVSRCLGGYAAQVGIDPGRFRIHRLVLAGVPNQGTLLVQPDHIVEFIDRMTTMLNIFPDNSVTFVLEDILTLVKVIGHAGLKSLEGIAPMKPGSPFLTDLDKMTVPGCITYGIGADFEPKGAGLGAAFCKAADSLIDRVFENAPNDLAVPTEGMRSWGGKIQIPDSRFLMFPASSGVVHTKYFSQQETSVQLLQWLTRRSPA